MSQFVTSSLQNITQPISIQNEFDAMDISCTYAMEDRRKHQ